MKQKLNKKARVSRLKFQEVVNGYYQSGWKPAAVVFVRDSEIYLHTVIREQDKAWLADVLAHFALKLDQELEKGVVNADSKEETDKQENDLGVSGQDVPGLRIPGSGGSE